MFQKIKLAVKNSLENHTSHEFVPTQIFLAFVTILSILSIILETVGSLNSFTWLFILIEWFAALVFTIEYLCRIYVVEKKIKYILSFWGFVDVVSILPTFIGLGNWTFLKSVRMLRILRLARIFRMAKISRAYLSSRSEAQTQADLNKANIVIYSLAISTITILFGSILYILENTSIFYADIPSAMLQTFKILMGGVGYAPVFSQSGEVIVVLVRFVGLALFGLMISIISGVMKEWLLGEDKK